MKRDLGETLLSIGCCGICNIQGTGVSLKSLSLTPQGLHVVARTLVGGLFGQRPLSTCVLRSESHSRIPMRRGRGFWTVGGNTEYPGILYALSSYGFIIYTYYLLEC